VLWLILVPAALYAAVVLGMFLGQDRLLYFPDRTLAGDPGDVGLAFRDVGFTTEDGVTLHGWHVPADGARWTVLFCHGNAGDIGDRLETIGILHDLGLSLLIFDYRGYGRSEGRPGEAGLFADARAAWRYLVEDAGVPPGHILVWGRSLGGAVAAQLATEVQPAGLVLESTFTSAVDVARRHYPWLPVGRLLRSRFDAAAAVARADCPKLILHSRDDEVVPWPLGVQLHAAAAPPKRLVELAGGHNGGFLASLATYRAAVRTFLGTLGEPDRAGGAGGASASP
jgi:hypothetical protein